MQQMLVCNSPKKLSPSKLGWENGKCNQLARDLELAMSLAASERPELATLRVETPSNLPGSELHMYCSVLVLLKIKIVQKSAKITSLT